MATRREPPTVPTLLEQRALLIAYCRMKLAVEDWHGVADAAMDLRELDAQIKAKSN